MRLPCEKFELKEEFIRQQAQVMTNGAWPIRKQKHRYTAFTLYRLLQRLSFAFLLLQLNDDILEEV